MIKHTHIVFCSHHILVTVTPVISSLSFLSTSQATPGVYPITHLESCWAWWSDRALISLETDDIDLSMNYVWGHKAALSKEKPCVIKLLMPFGALGSFCGRCLTFLPPSQAPLAALVNLWPLPFPGWVESIQMLNQR